MPFVHVSRGPRREVLLVRPQVGLAVARRGGARASGAHPRTPPQRAGVRLRLHLRTRLRARRPASRVEAARRRAVRAVRLRGGGAAGAGPRRACAPLGGGARAAAEEETAAPTRRGVRARSRASAVIRSAKRTRTRFPAPSAPGARSRPRALSPVPVRLRRLDAANPECVLFCSDCGCAAASRGDAEWERRNDRERAEQVQAQARAQAAAQAAGEERAARARRRVAVAGGETRARDLAALGLVLGPESVGAHALARIQRRRCGGTRTKRGGTPRSSSPPRRRSGGCGSARAARGDERVEFHKMRYLLRTPHSVFSFRQRRFL